MSTDVLSDLLRSLRASGTIYFCDQLKAPWTKEFIGTTSGSFHQIRRGSCWVESEEMVEHLGPGDFVFLAPGRDHTLSSQAPGEAHLSTDPGTLLLCGYCEFTNDVDSPMASLFPSLSIIRDESLQQHPWLKSILSQLSTEYLSQLPGALIAVNKLTEVLMVELIRMNFGRNEQSLLKRALADKHIAESLSQLHNKPSHSWTLENLASKVGLSRAGFAKRFKDLVGLSMFDYLTQLRVQRAKELLSDTSLSLHEVANQIGYESDMAFNRTFKKRTGITPTAYRKNRLKMN
jgi:AraC-like DNA-binding protein